MVVLSMFVLAVVLSGAVSEVEGAVSLTYFCEKNTETNSKSFILTLVDSNVLSLENIQLLASTTLECEEGENAVELTEIDQEPSASTFKFTATMGATDPDPCGQYYQSSLDKYYLRFATKGIGNEGYLFSDRWFEISCDFETDSNPAEISSAGVRVSRLSGEGRGETFETDIEMEIQSRAISADGEFTKETSSISSSKILRLSITLEPTNPLTSDFTVDYCEATTTDLNPTIHMILIENGCATSNGLRIGIPGNRDPFNFEEYDANGNRIANSETFRPFALKIKNDQYVKMVCRVKFCAAEDVTETRACRKDYGCPRTDEEGGRRKRSEDVAKNTTHLSSVFFIEDPSGNIPVLQDGELKLVRRTNEVGGPQPYLIVVIVLVSLLVLAVAVIVYSFTRHPRREPVNKELGI